MHYFSYNSFSALKPHVAMFYLLIYEKTVALFLITFNTHWVQTVSQVVVLNENGVHVVVTERKLMLTAWSSSSKLIWLRWETYTLKVVFVEQHTHFYVYVSKRSQIQFEDEDHAIYMSFPWVTTTCVRWEPQPVMLVPSVTSAVFVCCKFILFSCTILHVIQSDVCVFGKFLMHLFLLIFLCRLLFPRKRLFSI